VNAQKFHRLSLSWLCLTLAITLTVGTVNASPTQQTEPDFTAIDAYVQGQMDNLGIPGMALGIIQDGQIAHLQGFGAADSSGRAVTPQTPFYIGSITKSFTALVHPGGQRGFGKNQSAPPAQPDHGDGGARR